MPQSALATPAPSCPVEEVACDLCGSRDHRVLFHACDTLYDLPGTFPVVRCSNCRLVYVNRRPTAEALPIYYSSSQYDAHQPEKDTQKNVLAATIRAWIFARSTSRLHSIFARAYNTLAHRIYVASSKPGRILDIGCGVGGYLANWKSFGWEVEGLEPVPHVAEIARRKLNAQIYEGLIETADIPEAHYDIVSMCHSLEHTMSPTTALRRAYRALKPGGRLLVMVPNFASLESMIFGANWLGLEVPRHLYQFEPDTLRNSLANAGFVDTHIDGTAASGTLIRHFRHAAGWDRDASAPFPVRLGLNLTMVPVALMHRSKALWAISRRPV